MHALCLAFDCVSIHHNGLQTGLSLSPRSTNSSALSAVSLAVAGRVAYVSGCKRREAALQNKISRYKAT